LLASALAANAFMSILVLETKLGIDYIILVLEKNML